MIRMLTMVFALAMASPAAAQDAPDPRVEIEAAMADSAAGWNTGDIDRFLGVYADADSTTFVGEDVTRGLAPIRERYLESYPDRFTAGGAADAQNLSFTFEDMRMLGPDHVLVIARYHLTGTGAEATGMTSIIFERTDGGWKIIADHSS